MTDQASELSRRLPSLDATSMATALRHGEISSYELVRAHLDRVERHNSALNALVTINAERALERARQADQASSQGECWGALHGIPITVKDAFLTKGLRTTVGDKRFECYLPGEDAQAVTLMKEAGAIILGKTNCAPLCMDVQTANPVFGKTSNPRNCERTSGGSSGGEGAAVAAGFSPLGLGSDTAGSIRIPASYCGVYGFKPTSGIVSRAGLIPPLPGKVDLDHHLTAVGPLARSVRDLLLCHRILARARESVAQKTTAAELKVACTVTVPGMPLDDPVREALAGVASVLKAANISLEETLVPVDLPLALKNAMELLYFEFFPHETNQYLRKAFWKTLMRGGTFRHYTTLLETRLRLMGALDRFLCGYDCWMLPATPTTAPLHNPTQRPVTIVQNGSRKEVPYYQAALSFTFPFNLTGHPVVVLPVAADAAGLPVAVQLVGRRGGDLELLHCAALLDGVLGGCRKTGFDFVGGTT
jgi:amidase